MEPRAGRVAPGTAQPRRAQRPGPRAGDGATCPDPDLRPDPAARRAVLLSAGAATPTFGAAGRTPDDVRGHRASSRCTTPDRWGVAKWQGAALLMRRSQVRILPPQSHDPDRGTERVRAGSDAHAGTCGPRAVRAVRVARSGPGCLTVRNPGGTVCVRRQVGGTDAPRHRDESRPVAHRRQDRRRMQQHAEPMARSLAFAVATRHSRRRPLGVAVRVRGRAAAGRGARS